MPELIDPTEPPLLLRQEKLLHCKALHHAGPRLWRKKFDGDVSGQMTLCGPETAADEVHLCLRPNVGGPFEKQLESLLRAYRRALSEARLGPGTCAFRRVFLSDAANQRRILDESPLGPGGDAAAVSVIEQPPLGEQKLALLAYHVRGRVQREGATTTIDRGALRHLWTTGMSAPGPDSFAQTTSLFENYVENLASHSCTLEGNAVRTWLFARDVDRTYRGLVQARGQVFAQHGLDRQTHYIASTGIEGRHHDSDRVVVMDAYAIAGLLPGQQRYLSAPRHLGKTHDYGVHFERAVSIDYADRRHVIVSGTASIDHSGETAHVGQIARQVTRTCENIEALLDSAEADPSCLTHMVIYLRDSADREFVEGFVTARWPGVPFVTVLAPVCRPSWLVEIECMAWVPRRDDRWPAF